MSYLGQRVRRVEDPRLLQGAGQYVDDLRFPGMLYAGFVRSHHPSGRIATIDRHRSPDATCSCLIVGIEQLLSRVAHGHPRRHGASHPSLATPHPVDEWAHDHL